MDKPDIVSTYTTADTDKLARTIPIREGHVQTVKLNTEKLNIEY